MVTFGKPVSVPSAETEPFWEDCRDGVLRFQRCAARGEEIARRVLKGAGRGSLLEAGRRRVLVAAPSVQGGFLR